MFKFGVLLLRKKNSFEINISKASSIFKSVKEKIFSQPTVLEINSKSTLIVGDLHGDLGSFIKVLGIWKDRGYDKLIFLGDIVDRGSHALEIIYVLCNLLLKYNTQVFLIKGNHETERISSVYGFREELKYKQKEVLYYDIIELFDVLPYAGILNNNFFLVHGGIPKQKQNNYPMHLEEIKNIPKLSNDDFILLQLLWNDPIEKNVFFERNYPRGTGYFYGKKAVDMFLRDNALERIIRAHESVRNGIKEMMNGKVITVFSNNEYYPTVSPKILAIEDMELVPIELTKVVEDPDLIYAFIQDK